MDKKKRLIAAQEKSLTAVQEGDIKSLEDIFNKSELRYSSIKLLKYAAKYGNLEMIKLIIKLNNNHHNFITVEVSSEAAKGQHIHILEFLKSIECLDYEYLYIDALKNQNFKCLEWLTENYSKLEHLRKSEIIYKKDKNKFFERTTYDVIRYNKKHIVYFNNNDFEWELYWNEDINF